MCIELLVRTCASIYVAYTFDKVTFEPQLHLIEPNTP